METTIDISKTNSILNHVVEYNCANHAPHRTISSFGTTITFMLSSVLLEVGEYGGVCVVFEGETIEEEEVRLRLPLEGLKALLESNAYSRNSVVLDDPESYKSEDYEIIS